MTVAITFRTTSAGEWTGIGVDLDAAQVDRNFYNIQVKLDELETSRPQPNNIANITSDGMTMTIILDDASEIGPIPLPVLQFHWRGEYQANMVYDPLDAFMKTGVGIYTVIVGHFTPTTFDENLEIDGEPAYNKLFGADIGANTEALTYDLGFFFQGPISSSIDDILWQLPCPHDLTIELQQGHQTHLAVAPTTEDQVFPIFINDIQMGTITFLIGEIWGTIDWGGVDDVVMVTGDLLDVRKPANVDATAAGLSVIFLGTRAP